MSQDDNDDKSGQYAAAAMIPKWTFARVRPSVLKATTLLCPLPAIEHTLAYSFLLRRTAEISFN